MSTCAGLLDINAAAERLGVSRWTVRRLIDGGALPVVRLPAPGGRVRKRILLDATDIQALIDRSKETDL